MSIYDEYQIVITEAQRRLIVRALTNAMVNDRFWLDRNDRLHSYPQGRRCRPGTPIDVGHLFRSM
jgi:hypothetical protein